MDNPRFKSRRFIRKAFSSDCDTAVALMQLSLQECQGEGEWEGGVCSETALCFALSTMAAIFFSCTAHDGLYIGGGVGSVRFGWWVWGVGERELGLDRRETGISNFSRAYGVVRM
ncbi:hypothetical protein M011DRAFT_206661 [Sporormia fimetaria CBS 119925]|uniref:Uncharacterized protein n=1 Tax=Sporormia fimetaria CBS 119925 TaxID=1340428 RepID=A0A6A6V226_9PLEO|nr:hypothetical protein M011DRAFT_206661 [Sporormia fimetaria CBS 119925]